MLIHETLERSTERAPGKVALYFRDRKITYDELYSQVRRLASVLAGLGIRPRTRVALCLQNSPEFITCYYAILYCGGVVVPINTFLVTAEIDYILGDSQPELLITHQIFWERFEPILDKPGGTVNKVLLIGKAAYPHPIAVKTAEVLDFDQALNQVSSGPDLKLASGDAGALAELIYTSGTTGKPKGVMLSHHNLASNTASVAEALQATDADIYLLLLPVFHITSQQVCMLTPIAVGAGISVVEKIDRADLGYALVNHRPTIFIAVPTIYNMLCQLPAPPPDQNPVRLYVSGGAPLPMEIYQRFEQGYQKTIYQGYGLTEASPVVSWNIPGQNKPPSSGRALSGVQLKIVDERNQEAPAGEIGEICVKGDLVMMGYYNLPQATRETIVEGWLKTGDMGYLDQEGYLFVVDRKKEMLLYSGLNIYPREIEEVLHAHSGVLEAAVVGVKEPAKGELPIAFVTARCPGELDLKGLKEFCVERLARYKVPRQFFAVEQMPKTGSGKINKAELRARAEALTGGGKESS